MNQSSSSAGNQVRDAAPASAGASPGVLRLDAYCGSHPGQVRDHNEDAIRGTPLDYRPAKERGFLFIVADGMGGHSAGEVASNEAAQRVYQRYYAGTDPDVHRCLEDGIRSANAELYAQAQANPEQQGMGTTLTAAVIQGNHLYVAQVGDSRLYLLRNGILEQVTVDHSWVEEQVQAGVLTRSQADNHPQRNVITRALATTPEVRVDHFDRDLVSGDVILLNSDGLTTEVGEAQIAALVSQASSAREAAQALIRRANENGGRDNVSVAVLRVAFVPAAAKAALPRSRRPLLLAGIVAVLLLLLVGAALLAPSILGGPTPAPPAAQLASPSSAAEAPAAPAPPAAGATLLVATLATPQSGTVGPTATEAPIPTPAPSATPAPKASPGPTVTRQTVAVRIPAPVPKTPVGKETNPVSVDFVWDPPKGYALKQNEAYALVYWRKDSADEAKELLDRPTFYNVCQGIVRGPSYSARADAAQLSGSYLWTVVVVDIDPAMRTANGKCPVVSAQPEPKEFEYTPSGGGGGGGGVNVGGGTTD